MAELDAPTLSESNPQGFGRALRGPTPSCCRSPWFSSARRSDHRDEATSIRVLLDRATDRHPGDRDLPGRRLVRPGPGDPTGGIDLSIGAVMGIGGMIVANLTRGADGALSMRLPDRSAVLRRDRRDQRLGRRDWPIAALHHDACRPPLPSSAWRWA